MSVAFRGSTLSQLHTLSFQLLFQNFYLNGFTDVYVVKWNLAQGNMLNCFCFFQVPISLPILCELFALRPQHSEGFDRIP